MTSNQRRLNRLRFERPPSVHVPAQAVEPTSAALEEKELTLRQIWAQAQAAATTAEPINIESRLEEWALMTGWHGMVDLFYAKTILLKGMWAVVLGTCAFVSLNIIASMILDYWHGDHWVISTTYVVPKSGAVEWPNMTVKNLNWLGQSGLNAASLTDPDLVAYLVNWDIEAIRFYERMLATDTTGNSTKASIAWIQNRTVEKYAAYMAKRRKTRAQVRLHLHG